MRLEWPQPGSLGSLATTYRIVQRPEGNSQFTPASRVIIRGFLGSGCRGNASDPKCLQLANITYGLSSGPDTCGLEFCIVSLAGLAIYISIGPAQGQTRTILRSVNRTIYIDHPFDLFPPGQSLSQSLFNVYAPLDLGGICCRIQDTRVVAFVAGLTPGSVYQFKVFAGNDHEDGFETIGSNIVTAYTAGLPNPVTDLRVVNLVGFSSLRLAWSDPGGPLYCGDRRFQVFELAGNMAAWTLLNGSEGGLVKTTNIENGVGVVDLIFQGSPTSSAASGGPGAVSFYTVKTFCSTALGYDFGATYLDSTENAGIAGNVVPAVLQAAPSEPITGVRVVYVTQNSVLLSWNPVKLASIYKVLLAESNVIVAGPWFEPGGDNTYSGWPSQDQPQIYCTQEANLTGLDPTKSYSFRVLAGSYHSDPSGTFPIQSNSTGYYNPAASPLPTDISASLYRFTTASLTIRFNASASRSIDPTDQSQPHFDLFLRASGQSTWSSGVVSFLSKNVSLGCSNIESEQAISAGRNPGCDSFIVVNYDFGIITFQYSFNNLPFGQVDDIKIQTYNLNSPYTKSLIFSGFANRCVCTDPAVSATILFAGKAYFFSRGQMQSSCSSLYLLQSTLSCTLNGTFLYLMPPASMQQDAYTGLLVFVRSGPGVGQERTIVSYKGGATRLAILDSSWDVPPNENSTIEFTRPTALISGKLIGTMCGVSTTNCSILLSDTSNFSKIAMDNVSGTFIFLVDGSCMGQMRRIVAVSNASNKAALRVQPPFACLPVAGVNFSIFVYSGASKILASLVQAGPPLKVSNLQILSLTYNSVVLQWDPDTQCVSGQQSATPCTVSLYLIQGRQTHDPSNFPVQSNWSMQTLSTIPYVIFSGLLDMATYEIRVSAKRDLSDDFGNWSDSLLVKLTSGPPALFAQILALNTSLFNDRVLVVWTSDTNPPQADRFYITFGKTLDSMDEYRNYIDGRIQRQVFLDQAVCIPYISSKVICQTYVMGLQLGTIYYFKVYSGNRNGFEAAGSPVGLSATRSLPLFPVLNFTLLQIFRSINISGYAVQLGWIRPAGWPAVLKYYVAASISGGPFFNTTLTISSDDQSVTFTVTSLTKSTQYSFRIHCGNNDGPIGFHPNMSNDPSASALVNVMPDDVPGRPLLISAQPSVPDQNTIVALTWSKPQTGGTALYYTLSFCKVGGSTCTPSTYIGCSSTSLFCSTNPSCNAAMGYCVIPCVGAQNEGPASEGLPCRFSGFFGLVTGLTPGTQYQFNVSAVNDAGQGSLSYLNVVKATTLLLPTSAAGLNITAISVSTVRLDWFSSCATSCYFQITWNSSIINGMQVVAQDTYFVHSINLSARAAGISYRVFTGYSSTQFEQYGAGVYLPASATSLSVASATDSSLSFSFTPDPHSDTFQIWMSGLFSDLAFRPVSEESQLSTIRVEGLKTWVQYRFIVKSRVKGRTPYDYDGSAVLIAFASGLDSPPTGLSVVYTTSTQIKLTWNPPAFGKPTGYKVLRSAAGLNSFGYPVEAETSDVIITELMGVSVYDFKVFAESFQGYETIGSKVLTGIQPVDVPRDLTIRGVSTSSLTLQWLPPRLGLNPQAYRIIYTFNRITKSIADVVHYGGDDAEQSALVSSLGPGVFEFQVFSKSMAGFYEPLGSNQVFGAPLLAPVGLNSFLISYNSVLLVWNSSSSLTTLLRPSLIPTSLKLIYLSKNSGTEYEISNLSITSSNVLVTGLSANTRYQFVISGVDQYGFNFTTIGSNSIVITTIDPPLNLSILEVNASSVTLSWLSPACGVIPISYLVKVFQIPEGSTQIIENVEHAGGFEAQQLYAVSGLSSGRRYQFSVAAQAGTGDYSDSSNLVTTTMLSPPSFLRPFSVSAFSVSLVWNAPNSTPGLATPSLYVINYNSDFSEMFSIGNIQFGVTSFTIGGLQNGISYRFCLLAQSENGDYIAAVGGCCKATPIGHAQNLRVAASTFESLTLQWDTVSEGAAPSSFLLQYYCGYGLCYDTILQNSQAAFNASVLNILQNSTCWFVVFSNISGFIDPVGSNNVTASPVGMASNARMCFYQKTEIALQWAAPLTGPVPSAYRISYQPVDCARYPWQSCNSLVFTADIEHHGDKEAVQSFVIFGLIENNALEFRVHTKNNFTGLYDPVGSNSVFATPKGGRSDYALDLSSSMPGSLNAGYVLVSKAGDISKMQNLQTNSITVEAWVRLESIFAGSSSQYAGIAGNLYSFGAQYEQGAGHFGYGLFCVGFSCGMHIGTRTDLVTSVRSLCGSLVFPQPGCGEPGWTSGHRVMSGTLQNNVWYHLGGSYDSTTGVMFLALNGLIVSQNIISVKILEDGSQGPPPIYYGGERSVYAMPGDVGATMPWYRMDWVIGRALIGDIATTVDSADYASFQGIIDEVRVWSFGRSVAQILKTAVLDTVPPYTAGLLGYWAFDDPVFTVECADETVIVRDAASNNSQIDGMVFGTADLTLSSVPLDRNAEFSLETPINGTQFTVYVGDTVEINVLAYDPNPSDMVKIIFQLPGIKMSPTSAVFSNITESSASFVWSPVQLDAGKNISLCYTLINLVTNPRNPLFSASRPPMTVCSYIYVPLCRYKSRIDDTVRSIALLYQINWRSMYSMNPELENPDKIAPGTVCLVHHPVYSIY